MSRSRPLSSWGSSAEFIQLGISAAARKLPENNFYHPLLFSYHAEWLHSDTVFSSPFLSTSWVAELFFSPARFSSNKELFSTVEFGALGGIQLQWNFSSKCSAYTQIVAGPFFFGGRTRRQSYGFLFSDNLSFGVQTLFYNHLVRAEIRFRHLSNASTRKPNDGIDNIFFVIGIGL